jgi:hypothetical protein
MVRPGTLRDYLARSLPALMCGAADIVVVNNMVTRPPMTSVTVGGIAVVDVSADAILHGFVTPNERLGE